MKSFLFLGVSLSFLERWLLVGSAASLGSEASLAASVLLLVEKRAS